MKHFEFWPARVFEAPYYLWLLLLCGRYRLPPGFLAKANYALNHGEIGLGSKYQTQLAFPQTHFPATCLICKDKASDENVRTALDFAEQHGWPLILKPDMGAVGKGIIRLDNADSVAAIVPHLYGDHLLQAYCDLPEEFGVFYVNTGGRPSITGINQKHFPTVVGDGSATLDQLARAHPRYSDHWPLFLKYLDLDHVPAPGEHFRLSFVGSHTMGCKFTDDSELLTPELLEAVSNVCLPQPGFNFGRLDVRAESRAALQAGQFVVIEVNGVASLPTHMFDPDNSLLKGYSIFLRHGSLLALAAHEHRQQPMSLMSLREVWAHVVENQQRLEAIHQQALDAP